MRNIFKNKKKLLMIADISLIPVGFFLEWLSRFMLTQPGECVWTTFGGQCITCGGTHFVNSLLNGQIIQAYHHNELLFIYAVILLFSYIFLHLWWIWNLPFAKKVLRVIYSVPGTIIFCISLVVFWYIRNISVFPLIFQFIKDTFL